MHRAHRALLGLKSAPRRMPHPCYVKGALRLEERTTPDASPHMQKRKNTSHKPKYSSFLCELDEVVPVLLPDVSMRAPYLRPAAFRSCLAHSLCTAQLSMRYARSSSDLCMSGGSSRTFASSQKRASAPILPGVSIAKGVSCGPG